MSDSYDNICDSNSFDYDYDCDYNELSRMSSEQLINLINNNQSKYFISSRLGGNERNPLFIGILRKYCVEEINNKDENANSKTIKSKKKTKNKDHDDNDDHEHDKIPREVQTHEIDKYFTPKDNFVFKLFNCRNKKKTDNISREEDVLNLFEDTDPIVKYKELIQLELNNAGKYLLVVMNLYINSNLFDLIWEKGYELTDKSVRLITYQCILILKLLKNRRVVHNDFKMENLIVKSVDPLELVLTDFEFAQVVDKNENSNIFGGTDIYKSPEVLEREDHSYAADMWSLGVQIYYLFFNCYPYGIAFSGEDEEEEEEDDESQILNKIITRSLEKPIDNVPDDAFECISKMLEKDPSKRISPEKALNLKWFRSIHKDEVRDATRSKLNINVKIGTEINDA